MSEPIDPGLLWTFLGEAEAVLDALAACAAAPPSEDPDHAAELLGAAAMGLHSLKGVARLMGLPQVEQAAHRGEDLLAGAGAAEAREVLAAAIQPLRASAEKLYGGEWSRERRTERRFSLSRSELASVARAHGPEVADALLRAVAVPARKSMLLLAREAESLAAGGKKQVRVELAGEGLRADPRIWDRLRGPLLHLVRNALAHGIEDRLERLDAGKTAEGLLRLVVEELPPPVPEAPALTLRVAITVQDDGRGLDEEALKSAAREAGLDCRGRAAAELAQLPGVSTWIAPRREGQPPAEADRVAGRGLGLAAVRNAVADLEGELVIDSRPGQGLSVRLVVPRHLPLE